MENLTIKDKHYALIRELPAVKQGAVYKAIFDYAMEHKEPTQLTGMSKAIFENIRPYIDNVEKQYKNGKQGGRPSEKVEEPKEETQPQTEEQSKEETQNESQTISKIDTFVLNQNKTQTQSQSTTQTQSQDISQQESQRQTFKDKYILSLSINKNNLIMRACACVKESEFVDIFSKYFKDYFNYWGYTAEDKKAFKEVMNALGCMFAKAKRGEFKFNQLKYTVENLAERILQLDEDDIHKIVWQLLNNTEIQNREIYITGALLSRASEKKVGSR